MKRFRCQCNQEIFFHNSICHACGFSVGYNPVQNQMESWASDATASQDTQGHKLCANGREHHLCNWLIPADDPNDLCIACRLNRTIPNLEQTGNLQRWNRIEVAKRRLIYGLIQLNLPLEAPVAGYPRGLSFDFLEDQLIEDVPVWTAEDFMKYARDCKICLFT